LTTYEKAIHLQNKPLIPRDIIESDLSLQSYLEQNIIANREDEKLRQRAAKAKRTWISKRLEAASRKIKVEPSTSTVSEPVKQQQTKTWKCKPITEEPREGSLVTEQIKGIVAVCRNCNHKWTHHSKNLGGQYYASCPRCRSNVRLRHYKVG